MSHFLPFVLIRLPKIARGFAAADHQAKPDTFGFIFLLERKTRLAFFFLKHPHSDLIAHVLLEKAKIVVVIVVPEETGLLELDLGPALHKDFDGHGLRRFGGLAEQDVSSVVVFGEHMTRQSQDPQGSVFDLPGFRLLPKPRPSGVQRDAEFFCKDHPLRVVGKSQRARPEEQNADPGDT